MRLTRNLAVCQGAATTGGNVPLLGLEDSGDSRSTEREANAKPGADGPESRQTIFGVELSVGGGSYHERKEGPSTEERASQRKAAVQSERQRLGDMVDTLFAKYDDHATGLLNKQQIASLLVDISGGAEISGTEVEFVMRCADLHDDDGGIDRDEIKPAILVWNALRRQQDAVSQRFSKFQGPIEVPQVESLLSELNDGVPPPPSEVAWVIDRVDPHGRGFIEPEELRAAVALWYYRLALPDDQREGLGAQLGGAIEPEPEPALSILGAARFSRPTAAPMRGTTPRPVAEPKKSSKKSRHRDKKRNRKERQVARAVGDGLEYRDPETADDETYHHKLRQKSEQDDDDDASSTEEFREGLGFPAGKAFDVAVPRRKATRQRPATASAGFLAHRRAPIAAASSRLAAIEHRQAKIRELALGSGGGDSRGHHTTDQVVRSAGEAGYQPPPRREFAVSVRFPYHPTPQRHPPRW